MFHWAPCRGKVEFVAVYSEPWPDMDQFILNLLLDGLSVKIAVVYFLARHLLNFLFSPSCETRHMRDMPL